MEETSTRLLQFWSKLAGLAHKRNSVVWLDSVMAELLRFSAGPEWLLSSGAQGVVVFPVSSFSLG